MLVLVGGILEGEDKGAPSALHPAIIGGVDDAPFDTITFFLQALQDDTEIAATLGCRRLQQTIHILQQDIVRMVLLDDLIDRPPEHAFLALDALCTCAGNGIVLTGKTAHQKVVRRHLVDDSGDVCVHAVGIFAKVLAVALISPLTSLAGFPLVCPNRFESFGTTF